MPHDINTIRVWIRVVLVIAAICATSVPFIYSFSPWYKSRLGLLFMLQGISFAVAIDLSAFFSIWPRASFVVAFYVDALVLTAVAASTAALSILMLRMNHFRKGNYNEGEVDDRGL